MSNEDANGIRGVEASSILPHRWPYLFIESVSKHNKGEGVECKMVLDGIESYFAGHFPGAPILPGVFEVEAMFQAAEIFAILEGEGDLMLTKIMSAKFQKPIYPPGSFDVSVLLKKSDGKLIKFKGEVYGDAEKYAECSFAVTVM